MASLYPGGGYFGEYAPGGSQPTGIDADPAVVPVGRARAWGLTRRAVRDQTAVSVATLVSSLLQLDPLEPGVVPVLAFAPAHGLVDGDRTIIAGATVAEYNGTFEVFRLDADTFQYVFAGSLIGGTGGPITSTKIPIPAARVVQALARRAVRRQLVPTYRALVLADSPRGYWRLGDAVAATSVVDSSGNGYTGTPTAVTFGQAGALTDGDTAALFDGVAGVVDMGNLSAFNFTGAFSAEAWVKLTGVSSYVVVHKSNNNSGAGWAVTINNGLLRLWAYTLAGALVFDVSATSNAVHDGAWHHVAGAWDGTNTVNGVTLYVDGALIKQGTATAAIPGNTTNPVRIGAFNVASFLYFPGSIDEVAVYPTALSAAQIAAHAAAAQGLRAGDGRVVAPRTRRGVRGL